jgi:hypothetical protein
VSNRVVKGFQNDPLLVFGEFQRHETLRDVDLLVGVADPRVKIVDSQQERRPEMLVSSLLTFQPPGDLRDRRL